MEENIEILAIFNKYKDPFDDLINSLNKEFYNWPRLNDKRSHKAPRFKNNSRGFLKGEDRSDRSSWLVLETAKYQLHYCYDVAHLGLKSGSQWYKKG